jgi:hypothetical protein
MRRLFHVLLLLAILAGAGWLLLDLNNRRPVSDMDPWQAIPDQTAIIVSVPDAWNTWDRFTHTSQVWEAFAEIPAFAAAGRLMTASVERMQNDAVLREALDRSPLVLCVLRSGGSGAGGLFIGAPQGRAASIRSTLAELLDMDEAGLKALGRGDVVGVRPDTALPALSLCLRGNLWLLATSATVMDEALLQLERGTPILADSLLQRMHGTVGGGVDAHVLLHLRRAGRLLDPWFEPAALEELALPEGWAALDMRARPDALLLSGLLGAREADGWMNERQQQGAGSLAVARVLPASVSAVDGHHITDPMAFLHGRFGTAHEPELSEALFAWVGGTVGRAWAAGANGAVERWAFLQAMDAEQARLSIEQLCRADEPCEQQEYRGLVLKRLPVANALPRLLGGAYAHFTRAWWTILGDVVVFAPTPEAIRSCVDVWQDGNSLAEDPRFSSWMVRISANAGQLLWCDVARSRGLLRAMLRPFEQPRWDALAAGTGRLGGLSLQVSPGQRGYLNLVAGLQYAPLRDQPTGALWEVSVGALVERRPEIVRNHNNNSNEVLVQDVDHVLHLVGSTGKVLWSRPLDGPIMGRVHQIDRFRNGKLQLLFNTSDRIHLIDRNGKNVGEFPVALREKAAAPMAVFDYENERDYRILLPTAEGRLLNFGADGREVTGWEVPRSSSTAACAVHHLRIKNKDHLVFADNTGQIHILDRRGSVRERTALNLGPFPRVQQISAGPDILSSTVIWTDTAGVLRQANFAGQVHQLSLAGYRGSYACVDLEGDGTHESARVNGDTLSVVREGREVFSRTYGGPLMDQLQMHVLGAKRRALSVVRSRDGRISLLDDAGRELPGSPYAGMAPPAVADLNLDDKPELITVTPGGKVVAYRIAEP